MPDKIPLILFTGGMDSTTLLYRQLMQIGNCDTLYCNVDQSPIKAAAEMQRRVLILEQIEKRAPFHRERDIRAIKSLVHEANSFGHHQQAASLFHALSTVDPDRHSEVQMGYIMGDDVIGELDNIIQAWNGLTKAFLRGVAIPLVFPLRRIRKSTVLANVPKWLQKLTWSCETPYVRGERFIACGRCKPCRTNQSLKKEKAFLDGYVKQNTQHALLCQEYIRDLDVSNLNDLM